LTVMDTALISNEIKTIKSMFALGTDIHFVFYQPNFECAFDRAHNFILDMENKLSVFRPKSLVSKLNRYGSYIPIKVCPEVYNLIKKSLEYSKFSEGYFDTTIKRLMDLWKEAKQKNQMPSKEEVELALTFSGSENVQLLQNYKVKLKNKVKLDFGAIAKGFLADKIREIFEQEGINSAIVDLGGHILTVGKKHDESLWKVGIRHPFKTREDVLGFLELGSTSVVTSASYERYFTIDGKKLSHIINPKTGFPAKDDIASITVVDTNSTFADAMSTALFAMGFKKAISFIQDSKTIEAVVATSFREIYITPGLAQKFTLCDSSFRVIKTNEVIVL